MLLPNFCCCLKLCNSNAIKFKKNVITSTSLTINKSTNSLDCWGAVRASTFVSRDYRVRMQRAWQGLSFCLTMDCVAELSADSQDFHIAYCRAFAFRSRKNMMVIMTVKFHGLRMMNTHHRMDCIGLYQDLDYRVDWISTFKECIPKESISVQWKGKTYVRVQL